MKNYPFDHYYLYDEMTACLHELAADYPQLIKVYSICTTEEGREVWACEITNEATGDCLSKPAYYVDGLHHAGEVTGTMAALHFIVTLVQGYASNASIKSLLDTSTVYVIPRISPDGAETYLTTPERLRSVDRHYPFEKRGPGLHAHDMDGDGVIRFMRIKSETGAYKPSAEDPRVMVKRGPSDFGGEYYDLWPEGYVEDYDGVHVFPAEDKWGLDFNRNYPLGWFPEVRQPGAGKYPLSNPENRAVVEFVLAHPNICAAVTYHTSGGMYVYPPGTKSEKEADPRDMRMFREMGAMATEETGYGCYNIFDDFLTDNVNYSSGALDDWLYQAQGIPAYTAELWDLKVRAGIPDVHPRKPETAEQQQSDTVKCYKWLDENVKTYPGGSPFKAWTKFDHPQLGEVEIGSVDIKYTVQNCPPGYLEQEMEKNTRAQLRFAQVLPHLAIEGMSAEKTGEGVYKITAIVKNLGYLPTFVCNEAKRLKVDKPLVASLAVDGEIVVGSKSEAIGHLEGFSAVNDRQLTGLLRQKKVEPLKKQLTYVVKAAAGTTVTLSVSGAKAGTAEASVTLE